MSTRKHEKSFDQTWDDECNSLQQNTIELDLKKKTRELDEFKSKNMDRRQNETSDNKNGKSTTDNVTQNLDLATSMEQKKSEYEVDRLNQSTYVAADEESEISQS